MRGSRSFNASRIKITCIFNVDHQNNQGDALLPKRTGGRRDIGHIDRLRRQKLLAPVHYTYDTHVVGRVNVPRTI